MLILKLICFVLLFTVTYSLFYAIFYSSVTRTGVILSMGIILGFLFFETLGARIILSHVNVMWSIIWFSISVGGFVIGDYFAFQENDPLRRKFDAIGFYSPIALYFCLF